MNKIILSSYNSPVGELTIGALGHKLCICDWTVAKNRDCTLDRMGKRLNAEFETGMSEVISSAIEELDQYFDGTRMIFTIPLLFSGTEFQTRVWSELLKIPFGRLISYASLAKRINHPSGARAVASALANNPMSIFVPCHRVVGSNSQLTGYRGGIAVKESLIDLESSSAISSLF